MPKTPSPCINVCKFKREGHCIGCSMTKVQKSLFKALKKNGHRDAFISLILAQQSVMGSYKHWTPAYLRKCLKKKVKPIPQLRKAA